MRGQNPLRPARFARWAVLWTLSVASLATSGCLDDDTGLCCRVLREDAQGDLPKGSLPNGGGIPTNQIRANPLFDCDSLTCVSYRASEPFCTTPCDDSHPCGEGLDCSQVLESDSPPCPAEQPNCTRFTKEQRYCVRKACASATDCPEDFTCTTIYAGSGQPEDPIVKQCVRSDHACSAD
ncbi:MAG: hypothetical protein HYV07_30145 [Deltaproteobacteria bacterium]|nr:hypothetical protein [Deltaproteobacteria bacterium]